MLSIVALTLGAAASPGRKLASTWCNVYTCGYDVCSTTDVCATHKAGGTCEWWCNDYTTTGFTASYCSGCGTQQLFSYRYTSVTDGADYTAVTYKQGAGIQLYTKIKSATCSFATLMGAVFDSAALDGVQLYGFYGGQYSTPPSAGIGYVIDAAMTGPDACQKYCNDNSLCEYWYYQYELTNSSRTRAAGVQPAWFHKCQLLQPYSADGKSGCGSAYAGDANSWDEFAGRASAAGSKGSE